MIREYLSQKALVQNVSTIEELEERIKSGKPIHMMMGQTFDAGQPVDMMKYALCMMSLSDILKNAGAEVTCNWLIADHFITEINKNQAADEAREQMRLRVDYLKKINQVYGGDIGFIFSSQLSKTEKYQQNLRILLRETERNSSFREAVLKTVPPERRSDSQSMRYPLEELATIQTMDTDVKIGPVYEHLYDEPAREFAQAVGFHRYVAIQLTKSFPFGYPKMPPEISKEIEKFGVLPYKIGSKSLGEFRIDPLRDSLGKVRTLLSTTRDIRSLIDLLVIAEQAQLRLERGPLQSERRIAPQSLKISFFSNGGLNLYAPEKKFEYDEPETAQTFHNKKFADLALGMYLEFIHLPLRE